MENRLVIEFVFYVILLQQQQQQQQQLYLLYSQHKDIKISVLTQQTKQAQLRYRQYKRRLD